MNKDTRLIFEAYALNGLAKGKSVEDIAKKHGVDVKSIEAQIEKGTKTEHEHTKDEHTARKIATDHVFENPKYYDELKKIETKSEEEEMPYPEFAKLSKHVSPKSSKEGEAEDFKDQLPDSREEHLDKGEEEESTPLIVRGSVHDLGNGYSIIVTKENEPDRYHFDIDVLKNIDPKNSKYTYITQIHRLGEVGYSLKNWAGSKEPALQQKAIDVLKKYGVDLPDIKQEDEERRLDPKCWKGYHKAGTKLKGGVRVNKCVKNS